MLKYFHLTNYPSNLHSSLECVSRIVSVEGSGCIVTPSSTFCIFECAIFELYLGILRIKINKLPQKRRLSVTSKRQKLNQLVPNLRSQREEG